MRMTHYFLALALIAAPALIATAVTGVTMQGGEVHLLVGLFTAVITLATHTLMILFMIVTGRVMKAAMETRPLSADFLTELNGFFAQKKAYPVSGLAAVSIVAVGVLGYAQRAFGIPAEVHLICGVLATMFNLWALSLEWSTLRENQGLLDRTAQALDEIDRERGQRATDDGEADDDMEEAEPPSPARFLIVAFSAWLPYLYWAMIEWKGDFARVNPLFPIATAIVSAGAILAAFLARAGTRGPEAS